MTRVQNDPPHQFGHRSSRNHQPGSLIPALALDVDLARFRIGLSTTNVRVIQRRYKEASTEQITQQGNPDKSNRLRHGKFAGGEYHRL